MTPPPRLLDTTALVQAASELTQARPRPPSSASIEREKARCKADAVYFVSTYCKILDNEAKGWIPFALWPSQINALLIMAARDVNGVPVHKRLLILKARQEGLTWLVLAYFLWQILYYPISSFLLFSQREDEALALLDEPRLRGMYEALPTWMREGKMAMGGKDDKSEKRWVSGSWVKALPGAAGGDSRTVSGAGIDEADLIDDLETLLDRVCPTVGQSGQVIVFSRSNKKTPGSYFKRLCDAALRGEGEYTFIFIGWRDHPGRTQKWYDDLCAHALATSFTLDNVWGMYPETPEQALAERSLDKRISPQAIAALYNQTPALLFSSGEALTLPGLKLYSLPDVGRKYAIGVDPAEGNPTSDDSVAVVVDAMTNNEVATLAGKIEPGVMAEYVIKVAQYYNNAAVLVERNNHGGTVIRDLKGKVALRLGMDRKPGWHTNASSKTKMYDDLIKIFEEYLKEAYESGISPAPIIHDRQTSMQLAAIDANTLSAPVGQHDDFAVGYALAQQCTLLGVTAVQMLPYTGLWKPAGETSRTTPTLSSPPNDKAEDDYLKRRFR